MRYFFRKLSIFIILLSFVFLGGGAVVSYIENGTLISPEIYLIGDGTDVNISTVNNEGVNGLTSSNSTHDNNDVNTDNNNIINNNNTNNNTYDNQGNNVVNSDVVSEEKAPIVEEEPVVDNNVVVEEVDQNNVLRTTIQDTYGITIKYGSETEGYKVDTLGTVMMTDKNEINKALVDLQNTISLFPSELFWELKNNGYPLTIILIKNYSVENITGITESYSNRVNISIATKYSFGETFNHEVYHYLENFITKFKGASYSSWNTLNLSDFVYGSVRSDLSYNRTYSEDVYFVNNYAQTSANEDRASTFEYMMFANKASCLNENKPVWKKAKFMSQMLEKYLESVKPEVIEYWERHL